MLHFGLLEFNKNPLLIYFSFLFNVFSFSLHTLYFSQRRVQCDFIPITFWHPAIQLALSFKQQRICIAVK